MFRRSACLFVFILLSGNAIVLADSSPEIRVLVVENAKDIVVEGEGHRFQRDPAKGGDHRFQRDPAKGGDASLKLSSGARGMGRAKRSVRITAGESGLSVDGVKMGNELVITNSAKRYRVGEKLYRGSLTVIFKSPRSLMIVDTLPLEDYISGLINSEISSSWHEEAIKAQAVAARTYAMNQIEGAKRAMITAFSGTPPKAVAKRPYDIASTTLAQVYEGAHKADFRSQNAAGKTRGEVLLLRGEIFPAYYHSTCGGRTEHAHNVWPGEEGPLARPEPLQRGEGPAVISDPYCARSPKFSWSFKIPVSEFIEMLLKNGVELGEVRTIDVTIFSDSPRTDMLLIEDDDSLKMVKATEIRRIFGYQNVKSTWFDAKLEGGLVIFEGRGYGHGVGLCQWGAKAMAEKGKSYREILEFYYPDAQPAELY